MSNIAIIMALLPFVTRLIGLAENIFTGVKQGKVKKQLVMDATSTIVGGIASVSTGGQKETWSIIAEPISSLVDTLVPVMFPKVIDSTPIDDITKIVD